MILTTRELAKHAGVLETSIRNSLHRTGHFSGYVPTKQSNRLNWNIHKTDASHAEIIANLKSGVMLDSQGVTKLTGYHDRHIYRLRLKDFPEPSWHRGEMIWFSDEVIQWMATTTLRGPYK